MNLNMLKSCIDRLKKIEKQYGLDYPFIDIRERFHRIIQDLEQIYEVEKRIIKLKQA